MFKVVLGSMTFAREVAEAEAGRILEVYLASGGKEIDTAHGYGGGKTEEMLGRLLKAYDPADFQIATKANHVQEGGLSPEGLRRQLSNSLERLGLDRIHLLYFHQPDPEVPIENSLETCAQLHDEGRFEEFGLSNFAAWQVADIWHICRREGWIAPTVYQGMYNALTREVEPELFPCLRALGLRFYAYNPLAGGILTGRYRSLDTEPVKGRFVVQPNYRDRYWKASHFQGLDSVRESCDNAGISMISAALRWMFHHSAMDSTKGDAPILGTSKVSQMEENLRICGEPELLEEVVEKLQEAWQAAKPESAKYHRP